MKRTLEFYIDKNVNEDIQCWNCSNQFTKPYKLTNEFIKRGYDNFNNRITTSPNVVTVVINCDNCKKYSQINFSYKKRKLID